MVHPTHDTELARLLHRSNRVDVGTLKGILEEARRSRASDATSLGDLLVARGVFTPEEKQEWLRRLATTPRDQLAASHGSGEYAVHRSHGSGDYPAYVRDTTPVAPRAPARTSGEMVAPLVDRSG
jgi:hypothetical protein